MYVCGPFRWRAQLLIQNRDPDLSTGEFRLGYIRPRFLECGLRSKDAYALFETEHTLDQVLPDLVNGARGSHGSTVPGTSQTDSVMPRVLRSRPRTSGYAITRDRPVENRK
jgi:hypothetical protein